MNVQDCEQLTLFQGASPANLIACAVNVSHLLMNVICGANLQESFARLDQSGLWEKMYSGYCQVSMDGSLDEYLETWPKWGIMSDGVASLLTGLEPILKAKGSLLWPRPIASDGIAWEKNCKTNVKISIWKCLQKGKQNRTIYHYMWHGLNPNQAADMNEMMMGFPPGWTDLNA